MFVVPPQFGQVEDGVYRCAVPGARHFPFLASLRPKTLLLLSAEPAPEALVSWASASGVRLVHPAAAQTNAAACAAPPAGLASLNRDDRSGTGTGAGPAEAALAALGQPDSSSAAAAPLLASSAQDLPEAAAAEALAVLLAPENGPVVVCCRNGRIRTGIAVACLRKARRWALSSCVEEFRRFAGVKARAEHIEFVEWFDTSMAM